METRWVHGKIYLITSLLDRNTYGIDFMFPFEHQWREEPMKMTYILTFETVFFNNVVRPKGIPLYNQKYINISKIYWYPKSSSGCITFPRNNVNLNKLNYSYTMFVKKSNYLRCAYSFGIEIKVVINVKMCDAIGSKANGMCWNHVHNFIYDLL